MKRKSALVMAVFFPVMLACNLTAALTEKTASPVPVETQVVEIESPTVSLPATETPTEPPPVPIDYYYFVDVDSKPVPEGSVVILPDILLLAPAHSGEMRSDDPESNLQIALQAALADERNQWTSKDVKIEKIQLDDGKAEVTLGGEYFAPGDIVLIAAREQILLTIFTEEAVQAAKVTMNGKNITNWGISRESQLKPDDYTYTREDVETFREENLYQ